MTMVEEMPRCPKEDWCVLSMFHVGRCSRVRLCDPCNMDEHRKCAGRTCECPCSYSNTRRDGYII